MMGNERLPPQNNQPAKPDNENEAARTIRRAELLALFRILMKEPPPDHDFATCPICKRFGLTSI